MFVFENKPVISYNGPFYYDRQISLTIKRIDLPDTITGGNKWFKLRYNLERFKQGNYSQMVTFGGAFSNHIAAVARAAKMAGIPTLGIIRGEPASGQNITLSRANSDGMNLIFVSREDYRKKENPEFLKELVKDYNNSYILPEGGSNLEGVKGCTEILTNDDESFTHIVVACGTGATAAGIILSLKKHQCLAGISVLRNGIFLEDAITGFLNQFPEGNEQRNWHIEHDFHFGGYGKTTPELNHFIQQFSEKTGVPAEPVYTGKLFFAIEHLIKSGSIKAGANILAIHTGGMQYLSPV